MYIYLITNKFRPKLILVIFLHKTPKFEASYCYFCFSSEFELMACSIPDKITFYCT